MSKLIISPHLDDAALSVGGLLLNDIDKNNKVLTIFNTAWTALDNIYDYNKITELNLREELEVMKGLNCKHKFLNLPEALLRGYETWNDSIDMEKDTCIINKLTKIIADEVDGFSSIYFPLAIGEHVDHLLLFNVAMKLINSEKNIFNSVEVFFYEDLPYCTYEPITSRIEKVKKLINIEPYESCISNVIEEKCKLIYTYKSQITENDVIRVRSYSQKENNENMYYETAWKLLKSKIN
ncbi:hypothetical protein GCM10008908_18590 [Clostridium subterminale]|uniref:PIG-L family deacetylase n=1 Tax=Clostridium subterminale TaxID=1550 RepID=A0ABN1KNW6_CLOSU